MSAIKAELGLPASHTLTATDLNNLRKLDASDRGIVNVAGLGEARNLKSLNLADNEITDLSEFERLRYGKKTSVLSGLKYLNLADNSITNTRPLRLLTGLDTLNLADNEITEHGLILPMDGVTHRNRYLKYLNASSNSITGTWSLTRMRKLTTLYLADNNITDLSNLPGSLERLAIGENPLNGDISRLAGMTKLEWLMINSAGVTDLSDLEGLTKLKYLDVSSNNNITDFFPLVCMLPEKGALNTLVLRGMPKFFRVVDGENVPKQDWPSLLVLASKGVTITF